MQVYTNRFNIIVNHDKTEVILNFSQGIPVVRSNDPETQTSASVDSRNADEPIANLVMTGDLARNLATVLLSLLDQNTSE